MLKIMRGLAQQWQSPVLLRLKYLGVLRDSGDPADAKPHKARLLPWPGDKK